MSERIYSLRKEVVLKEEYRRIGVDDILSDIKISMVPGAASEFEKKLRSAVKRKIKKLISEMGVNEILSLVHDASSGPHKISIKLMPEPQNEVESTIIELLSVGSKLKGANNILDYYPAEICTTFNDQQQIAYTLLKHELPTKYHNRRWGLKRNSKSIGYFMFADLIRSLSNVIVNNNIISFTLQQQDYIQFKITEYYVSQSEQSGLLTLPECTELQELIRENAHSNHLSLPTTDSDHIIYDNTYSLNDYLLSLDKNNFSLTRGLKEIVIPRMSRMFCSIQEKVKRMLEEHSSYAKSFQTKKHIKTKNLEVMSQNQFLSIYGYVELDNDTDITKFKQLELEFNQLREYLGLTPASDHSFRIRKLGRHQAAGLYYPYYKTLVIDLDSPDAFIHELGHQLDHTMIQGVAISDLSGFYAVSSLYERMVEKQISQLTDDDPFKLVWEGTTKYNQSYYLENTEIFARSFEIYLKLVKKYDTSFLKENYSSPVYPTQPEFLCLIESFFESLLGCTKPEELTLV
ncbi:hypothetical protein ASD24_24585 [Paenibacillus sp. Root52]|uniref:hypothetical protein n=1 Tax=Paenibacillus sp. Root52 TaxID=1736552 RepID=UPI0006F74AEC|nr:hypothetical protein [Paenibacillus sp. Root52]KQY90977.1 hypothetical protein ASD24_24585 [Paenibacillus sp. Root52]